MIEIPMRLKILAATGLLAGGLGAAAVSGAFAAPSPDVLAAATGPAATPTQTTAPRTPTAGNRPGRVGRFGTGAGFTQPLATFLGISTTELQTDLKNGQTLAQIGQAHGKSTTDLKNFLTSQLKSRLDQAVANGRLTSQQESTMLNNASSRFDKLISTNFQQVAANRRGRTPAPRIGAMVLPTVAQTLGMSQADVRTELQNGKTLAQIAQEHGKTSADLETAIINAMKPQLDKLLNTNFQQLAAQARARRSAGGNTSTPTPTPASR